VRQHLYQSQQLIAIKTGPCFRLALLSILPIGLAIICNQRLARHKNASVFNYGQLLGLVLFSTDHQIKPLL
jgi:uncharacterized membrane protein YccF (DUF307 family)